MSYAILVATESTCDIYAPDDREAVTRRIAALAEVVGERGVTTRELANLGELRVDVMEAKFKRIAVRYHAPLEAVRERCPECGHMRAA